jgi:hypothetical protein
MTDRFEGLKKIPAQPAARLLAVANAKLQTPLESPASAPVGTVLAELSDKDALPDMIRLLSVALPPREAVWWACIAARDLTGDEVTPCLRAAEAWVFGPTDERRRAVQMALEAAEMDDDTTLVATAALYAPGDLGPGEMSEHPAPPGAVSSCAFGQNLMTLGAAEDPVLQMHWLIDRALDIARGGNGKVPVPEVDTSLPPLPDDATGEDDEEEDA